MSTGKSFVGLHVLLTGASGGVGGAILKQLSARGARIFATSKTPEKLQAKIMTLSDTQRAEIKTVAADFTFPNRIEHIVESALQWLEGRIDVLINNAGIGYHCRAANIC